MSAKLGNIELKNPVMIGAGPWARDAKAVQKCIDTGVGAVITETITLGVASSPDPCFYSQGDSIFNIKLFSSTQIEEWGRTFENIDKKGAKIIASIWASTPSELGYIAKKVSDIGFDAIEISLSSPIGARNRSFSEIPSGACEYVKAVTEEVDIPVIVKLSYESSSNIYLLDQIYNAGIRLVSAIDGLRGLNDIDVVKAKVKMPTFGGYTGAAIRPVSLAITAMLKQNTKFSIYSAGGITDHTHAIEYIMLGAEAVQVASVIMLKGYDSVTAIVEELSNWITDHGYNNADDIRGKALSGLMPFENLKSKHLVANLRDICKKECDICITSCLYDALIKGNENAVMLDRAECVGCGLCIERCPDKLLYLDYS